MRDSTTIMLIIGGLALAGAMVASGGGASRPEPQPEPKPPKPPPPNPGDEPLWPLPGVPRSGKPKKWGKFGARRTNKEGVHTREHRGVDIGAPEGSPIVAMEDGVVQRETGWITNWPHARGLLFESLPKSGAIKTHVYGAIAPGSAPAPGTYVRRGELLGRVGRYPGGSTMLHFELWEAGSTARTRNRNKWYAGEPQPDSLLDPTEYLLGAESV